MNRHFFKIKKIFCYLVVFFSFSIANHSIDSITIEKYYEDGVEHIQKIHYEKDEMLIKNGSIREKRSYKNNLKLK